jgi:alginate O-acetyltransferase complex protein AlgJ
MRLRALPALFGALVMLSPALVPVWNACARAVHAKSWVIFPIQLAGVQVQPPKPHLSLSTLWSGTFAHDYATRLSRNLRILSYAVKIKSQAYYSLLEASPIPAIVVGRNHTLYEPWYIAEYCTRDLVSFAPKAEDWAIKLRLMQDYYQAKGQVFVYVITPSKAAVYPEYIPASWPCPADHEADRRHLLEAYRAVLDRHGVHFVDTATIVRQARERYPFLTFPRGGTHWTEIGAALGAQALIKEVNSHRPARPLESFTFEWRLVKPAGTDRDLMNLLNLIWPDLNYVTPRIDVEMDGNGLAKCGTPAKAMLVGGSFLTAIWNILQKSKCGIEMDYWGYFLLSYFHFPGNIGGLMTPAWERERDQKLLAGTDIVLFEENEQIVARSNHFLPFFRLLKPYLASAAR